MALKFFSAGLAALVGVGFIGSACQFDSEDVCGPELLFNATLNVCQCPRGTIIQGPHCVACGVHEVALAEACECESGFVRGAGGACEAPIEGLNDACDANQASACAGKQYNYCASSIAGSGYCTQATCTASADCPSGYTCATWASPAFCMRPPTGLGDACAGAADCSGKEAGFCESLISNSCLVQNCDLVKNDCIDGFGCCDLSTYNAPNLCVPAGRCPK